MALHQIRIIEQGRYPRTKTQVNYTIADAEPKGDEVVSASMIYVDEKGLHYIDGDGEDTVIDPLDGAIVAYCDNSIIYDTREY